VQTFLVWQLAFSSFILGRSYSFNQIAGCILLATGVVVAVARYSTTFSAFLSLCIELPATTDHLLVSVNFVV
jgi:hypothetical protein